MVKTSLRMTSWIPLLAALVLLGLQILSPAPAVMFILVAIVGVLLISYVWARQVGRGVTIQRKRRYGWAQVGDVLEERFIMHNDSLVPVLWAEVRDMSDLPGYNASRAVGLPSRTSTRWTTEGVCERRGIYSLGPIEIRMGDPFGLFEAVLKHEYTETFVVFPPVAALPPLLEPRGMTRGAARANIRSLDLTTNASSVRNYVPGDALNRIHWRTTARRSTSDREEIFVKEFDLEPSGDVWLVLDLDARGFAGEEMESTEEYAVIIAASLANSMLRGNQAVGLVAYGEEPVVIPPQRGYQQLWELLRVLAGVHSVSQMTLGAVLRHVEPIISRSTSVALITPSSDPEWIDGLSALLRRGIHSTAILLDARSFGGDGDAQGVVGALADLGVVGHILAKGFRFELLTERRQQRPQYRVLGTGRVVVVSSGDESQAEWVPVGYEGG